MARSKGLVELTHISKSGGTSMCRAAQYNGCSNPAFDVEANCMIKAFQDDPKWSLGTDVKIPSQKELFHVGGLVLGWPGAWQLGSCLLS